MVLEQIAQTYEERGIKLTRREMPGQKTQALLLKVAGKNFKQVNLMILANSENPDCVMRAPRIADFTEERREQALDLINRVNQKYRFIKLILEDDNTVTATADLPTRAGNPGPVAHELFIRMMTIIDEVYPQLMKAVWGD